MSKTDLRQKLPRYNYTIIIGRACVIKLKVD